jgi:hypothetical protein
LTIFKIPGKDTKFHKKVSQFQKKVSKKFQKTSTILKISLKVSQNPTKIKLNKEYPW